MNIEEILKAETIEEFKKYGSYLDTKRALENLLGVQIKSIGWNSLYNIVTKTKEAVNQNKKMLELDCTDTEFKALKKKISEIIPMRIKAKTLDTFVQVVHSVIEKLSVTEFDPYSYYEKIKFKKFKDSSKLEGIDIDFSSEESSL